MRELKLSSGFILDYKDIYNEHCIQSGDVDAMVDKVREAHELAQSMRRTGVVEGHVSKDGTPEPVLFSQLPYVEENGINTPQLMERLERLRQYGRNNFDAVISLGIGGSYLGSKVLFDVQCGSFWNQMSDEERNGYPKVYFAGYNADARYLQGILTRIYHDSDARAKQIIGMVSSDGSDDYELNMPTDGDFVDRHYEPYKVLLMVNSKSGSTIEPMANFMILENALKGHYIDYEVIAITDTESTENPTILHAMALENGWKTFSVPYGVGGRFSVFTEVSLTMGALIGFDVQQFLAGAQSMDRACQTDHVFENPALLSAVLKYISAETYGRVIEVFMPYGDCLRSLSDWYVQLLAESLGKQREHQGPYSRTPVAAVGTTDMHAQVQEHQEGRLNKVVQFIKIKSWGDDLIVPNSYGQFAKLEAISNIGLSQILNVALDSNQEALTSDNRFNMTIELPELNAFHLGELMYMYCWAIFYESILAGVDAFDQPGVEVYKRILGPKIKALKEQK